MKYVTIDVESRECRTFDTLEDAKAHAYGEFIDRVSGEYWNNSGLDRVDEEELSKWNDDTDLVQSKLGKREFGWLEKYFIYQETHNHDDGFFFHNGINGEKWIVLPAENDSVANRFSLIVREYG